MFGGGHFKVGSMQKPLVFVLEPPNLYIEKKFSAQFVADKRRKQNGGIEGENILIPFFL